jgi:hypothetical protein
MSQPDTLIFGLSLNPLVKFRVSKHMMASEISGGTLTQYGGESLDLSSGSFVTKEIISDNSRLSSPVSW